MSLDVHGYRERSESDGSSVKERRKLLLPLADHERKDMTTYDSTSRSAAVGVPMAAGFGASADGRGAEKNGVRLRKVFAGIEIVDLGYGGPGREGGSEFVEAGFQVGDVLTKVDNVSLIGEEVNCAAALQMIAEGQDGVGQAFVEGFRRVAAFPRPTRTTVCCTMHVAVSIVT